jgi:predicted DsbA family dithiol-disulfide isomerase
MTMSETKEDVVAGVRPSTTIDVVSDVVCPWCYIGKRRLEAALDAGDQPAPPIRWHPFQLNPDIPAGGVDRRTYLEDKFGGPERAREIYARVEAAGREVGIEFNFERIARQPNTLDAHRLIAWAQSDDFANIDRLVERLFRAYFEEGIDIGDVDELARLASEAGYDMAAARVHLASAAGRAEVAAADERTKSMGIGGVPFFIFNQRVAVSGAQPPEVLRDALAQSEVAA